MGRLLRASLTAVCAAGMLWPAAGAAQAQTPREPAVWSLYQALAGQNAIAVQVQFGGCQAAPDAVADETATSVTVYASVGIVPVPDGVSCAASLIAETIDVPLAHPLAGRPISGPDETWDGLFGSLITAAPTTPGATPEVFTPNFVGLSPLDALRLALAWREPVTIVTGRQLPGLPRIVRQTPRTGSQPTTLNAGVAAPLKPLTLVMSP